MPTAPSRNPAGSSHVVPPLAMPASWNASHCSGESTLNPIVLPLPCVARLAVSHAFLANGSEGVEIVSAVLHEAAHSGDWQRSVSYSKCIIADDNIDAV